MARVPKKFKAQLITTNSDGKQVKRNFNNVRSDISDADLSTIANSIGTVLASEKLKSMSLTANSALTLE